MPRLVCLLGLLVFGTATAAPVPKEKPDPLPDGARSLLSNQPAALSLSGGAG
jgi:hypothetical protein